MDAGRSETDRSRRAFLARAGLIAAGLAAVRCGSESPSRPLATDRAAVPAPGGRRRPPLPDLEPLMRVRIFRGRGRTRVVGIGQPGQRLGVKAGAEELVELEAPVQVILAADGWTLHDERGVAHAIEGLRPLDLERRGGRERFLRLGPRSYPGGMRLVARHDLEPGAFDVINLVMMEDYLPGVVAGELYDHWTLETRAAQAVAARSFASSEHAIFLGRRAYDVSSTAASQVYLGRVRHRDSIEAIEMTRGLVLASDGLLVPGYYSACCGGLAARAVDAIGPHPANDVPPLEGRSGTDVCVDKKVARWTIVRRAADLVARLRAWGKRRKLAELAELAVLEAVDIARTNAHGRPVRYTIKDAKGPAPGIELSAEAFRNACNYAGPGVPAPKETLWASHVEVTVSGDEITFDGHGFGHGVGLCQYGAETLARAGRPHREILAWYYPGADHVRAYS